MTGDGVNDGPALYPSSRVVPPTGAQWTLCVGCAVGLLVIEEVIKFFLRRRAPTPAQPVEDATTLAA